jgi:hypothetical protein
MLEIVRWTGPCQHLPLFGNIYVIPRPETFLSPVSTCPFDSSSFRTGRESPNSRNNCRDASGPARVRRTAGCRLNITTKHILLNKYRSCVGALSGVGRLEHVILRMRFVYGSTCSDGVVALRSYLLVYEKGSPSDQRKSPSTILSDAPIQ